MINQNENHSGKELQRKGEVRKCIHRFFPSGLQGV